MYLHYLHSTMYLFQPLSPNISRTLYQIYIPLCIYFNMNTEVNYLIQNYYLHSTMYLFQLPTDIIIVLPLLHLHSTMYLFQPCFGRLSRRSYLYLHSTMYLFQPGKCFDFVTSNEIYIPLCIYFNMFPTCHQPYDIQIYIPLCIYFNAGKPESIRT